jgi:urease accessory protein UreF
MEAQAMQFQLSQRGELVLERCAHLEPGDATQTQPLHDLWQGSQDRLYSRLFQS